LHLVNGLECFGNKILGITNRQLSNGS
jgi:hypothetical protein